MTMTNKILAAAAALLIFIPAFAQNKADDILGDYYSKQGTDEYKVRISKKADGRYKAQIFWVSDPIDHETGKIALDPKNPDKSLREVPCDRIVLIDGLKFNEKKNHWDGAKIYDPQRGIKVAVTTHFESDGRLAVRGSVLGIGETVHWQKIPSEAEK